MGALAERIASHRPGAWVAIVGNALPMLSVIVLAVLMQQVVGPVVKSYWADVLLNVGVSIILAVSLNIVNGYTGQFSIGHAGFMAVGGYVAASATYYGAMFFWQSPARYGGFLGPGEWLLVGGCVLGACVAALFGFVVGLPSLRLRGDYLAIVTLGFGEIIRVLLQQTRPQLYSLAEYQAGTLSAMFPPPLGGALGFTGLVKYANLFWVFIFVGLTLLAAYRLKVSSMGRAFLSIREDEIAARAMGIDITKYKVRAFVLAAFFAGIAGGLYAHTGPILMPREAGFQRSFDIIIMVVLGGMGSISGATLAAIVLTITAEWLREPTHVWYLAVYLGLVRVAFARDGGLRLPAVIVAVAIVIEAGRAMVGSLTAFGVGSFDVQLYELAYLALLIVLVVIHRETLRAILMITSVIIATEIVRAVAIHFHVNLGDYRMIIYALLLITMMIVRPQGLFGVREIWELFGRSAGGRVKAVAD